MALVGIEINDISLFKKTPEEKLYVITNSDQHYITIGIVSNVIEHEV